MLLLTLLSHQWNFSCSIAFCIVCPNAHSGPLSPRICFHMFSGLPAFFAPKHAIQHLPYILFNRSRALLYGFLFFFITSLLSLVSKLSNCIDPSHKWHLSASWNLTITLKMKVLMHTQSNSEFPQFKAYLCAWSWRPQAFALQSLRLDTKIKILRSVITILNFESSRSVRSHFPCYFH